MAGTGPAPARMNGWRNKGKTPVRGVSAGSVTHNLASEPGELVVTVGGRGRRRKGDKKEREILLDLDEAAAVALVRNMARIGYVLDVTRP